MRFNRVLFVTLLCLTVSSSLFASGFAIFEQGAKATAMGGAFVATADDPSAIYYNVAGLAQQRHMMFMGGATTINFANEFTGDPNDPFTSGTTAQYRRHTFVPPNAYAILPVGQNITLGVGTFVPFGLRTNWEEPFVGRFISRDANVKTMSIEPALAWQTTNGKVAIGVGAEYRRSHIVLNRNNAAFNPFTGRISDVANAFLNSDWNNAWGYNVGVLLKPTAAWRIGASYRAGMTIDYTGDAKFTQIPTGTPLDQLLVAQHLIPPNQKLTTAISYPSILQVGVATTLVPAWDVEFDVTRTGWSSFDTLDVQFATTPANNLHRPQNWHDSSAYRLGANHRVSERWDVRFGALYDQNPQPTEGVGPLLPDSDRIGASFGIGYRTGPWTVDATEFLLHFKERSTQGRNLDGFNGTYRTDANLISLNLGYRF